MTLNDLLRKLSSRKFWAMLIGQIIAILTALNCGDKVIFQVGAVVGSVGSIAVYILAEARIDRENIKNIITTEREE